MKKWKPSREARTIRLTEKGERELEYARRLRLYPHLDPEKDWIEIPTWMLNSNSRTAPS